MIRRPPRSTPKPSSAASDVYKRQPYYTSIGVDAPDTLLSLLLYRSRGARQTWRLVELAGYNVGAVLKGLEQYKIKSGGGRATARASGRRRAIDAGGPRLPSNSERATSGGARTTARSTGDGRRSTNAAEGRQLITTRSRAAARSSVRSIARSRRRSRAAACGFYTYVPGCKYHASSIVLGNGSHLAPTPGRCA